MKELESVFYAKASKVRAQRRTADINMVVELARTASAEHTARFAQSEGDLRELQSKLDFFEAS